MELTNLASLKLMHWKILKKYKQNPDDVFRKVGLNPNLMHTPGSRYPQWKSFALWEEMSLRIPDPCYGLSAAECWHPSHLGTLGYAMLASSSLRITLERLIRFHQVISDPPFAELKEDKEQGVLNFTLIRPPDAPYAAPQEDAILALTISILRMNFQQELLPDAVSFSHGQPECIDAYTNLFQSQVIFDRPICNLALSLSVVDIPLPSGHEQLVKAQEQIMNQYLATLTKEDLSTKVQQLIVEHLPSGDASLESTASELYMSPRTLQRLLHNEGKTFLSLLNETREKIARQYVCDKNKNMTEVAFVLGFSDQSAFSRSFKRWTGKSPTQYRKAA